MDLFKAETVRVVCDVTERRLSYWVERELVHPTRVVEAGRRIYFFSYQDIVLIRLIRSLRDAGLSLQRIRSDLRRLSRHKEDWLENDWLVTDGKQLFSVSDDPRVAEAASDGQTVLTAVALGWTKRDVERAMDRLKPEPVDICRFQGRVLKYQRRRA